MLDHYLTIHSDGKHEIIIEKSRFICHIKRDTTENEAHSFIQAIKKEHRHATHNCSAYIIGENDQFQKAHDDGEQSGTAGVPMLEVLKKKALKNGAAVVTRFFGGTKLGAGGLVRAYGSAVSEAIQA
ncbi:YigZ family protein, partial [Listeria monocytogenes]|uniref:YigZ family protein n=1 Tax=Listeria monocytogenes TaxID=1639 RepID=UPI0034A3986C